MFSSDSVSSTIWEMTSRVLRLSSAGTPWCEPEDGMLESVRWLSPLRQLLLLIVVGLVPGLVAFFAAAVVMSSFSSDQFPFDREVRPTTFVSTALATLAVGFISQWPALQSVECASLMWPQLWRL